MCGIGQRHRQRPTRRWCFDVMDLDQSDFWDLFDAAQRHAFEGDASNARSLANKARGVIAADLPSKSKGRHDLLTKLIEFINGTRQQAPTPTPTPAPGHEDIEALEAALRRDPSRPDLWIAAARAHWAHGNVTRARQLLHRVAASKFKEHQSVDVIVQDWLKKACE